MLSRIPALSRLAPSRSDVSELRCPPTFDTPQILITAFISVRMIDVRRTSILQDMAEVTLPEALRWIREALARGGPHPELVASRDAGRQSSSLFGRRSSRVAAAVMLENPGMEGGTCRDPKTNALSVEAGITPTAGLSSSRGQGESHETRVSAELKPGSHGFLKQPSSSWLQARLRRDVLHGLHKSAPSIRIYAVQLGGMYYEVAALHGVILTMLQHGRGEEEEEKERHSVKRSARALGEGFVGRSGRPSEAAGGDEEQGPPRHDASGTGRSALSTLTYRKGSQSGAASRSSRGGVQAAGRSLTLGLMWTWPGPQVAWHPARAPRCQSGARPLPPPSSTSTRGRSSSCSSAHWAAFRSAARCWPRGRTRSCCGGPRWRCSPRCAGRC